MTEIAEFTNLQASNPLKSQNPSGAIAQNQGLNCRSSDDRNYREVLAVWDWMFGTLYVPEREEILEFGLADAEGNKLPQRHDTLAGALIAPVTDALAAMGLRRKAPLPPKAWPGE
jgi:hypothetical protein